jgi:hypothetical protein
MGVSADVLEDVGNEFGPELFASLVSVKTEEVGVPLDKGN